jgi:hypothetical protein
MKKMMQRLLGKTEPRNVIAIPIDVASTKAFLLISS